MTVLTGISSKRTTQSNLNKSTAEMSDFDEAYFQVEHLTHRRSAVKQKYYRHRFSQAVLVLVVFLAASVAANIIGLFWLCRRENQDGAAGTVSESLDKHTVCADCSIDGLQTNELMSEQFENVMKVYELTPSIYFCCVPDGEALYRMLEVLFLETVASEDLGSLSSNTSLHQTTVARVSQGAHLYIDSKALKSPSPSLRWTEDYGYGAAYVTRGITNDKSWLRITQSGLYHVYSFLTFKKRPNEPRGPIVHTVCRNNTELPEMKSHVILMNHKMWPAVDTYSTSFLSGTVRLRRGDLVFVKVMDIADLYPYGPSSYFGLFSLRSDYSKRISDR